MRKQEDVKQMKKCSVCLLILALLLSCLPGEYANAVSTPIAKHAGNSNPLIDHHLGADPFALTYNGRVYIYMSSDDYEYNSDGTIKDNPPAAIRPIGTRCGNRSVICPVHHIR